jgi:hypothetical protein
MKKLTNCKLTTLLPQGQDNSPPESPPLRAAYAANPSRRGADAHHIRAECERLCCETLRSVFLGERKEIFQDSLVLDAQYGSTPRTAAVMSKNFNGGFLLENSHNPTSLSDSVHTLVTPNETGNRLATEYFEVWDYVGGTSFRGFIAERPGVKSMFVFLKKRSFQTNMKAGYVLPLWPLVTC